MRQNEWRPRFRQFTILTVSFLFAYAVSGQHQPTDDKAKVATSPQTAHGSADPAKADRAPVQISDYPEAPLEDRNGNLWFCTAFDGLIRYDGTEFVSFTTDDGLPSNTVRDILEDEEGVLWIATASGLVHFDGTSFTTLTDYEPGLYTYGSFGKEGNHRELWDVLKDRHGTLWIATMDGVFRHNGTSFSHFLLPVIGTPTSSEFIPRMVYSIFEDKDGALWFGTDGAGVVRYDGSTMSVFTEKENGLCSDRICTITQDRKGNMWFGSSDGGVSRFDGRTFTTHLRTPTFSEHVGWGRFFAIHEDKTGHLWLGGSTGGVYRYDGVSFEYFSEEEGLGEGNIIDIREDRSGAVWIGSTAGVHRFDGKRFVNFTRGN